METKKNVKTVLNLTQGRPIKMVLLFAIPVFFGNLFQILYSLVDTKIVGSILGETALSAVGSVSTLYTLLTGFFNGLSLGFGVLTARYYGSGDEKGLKKNIAGAVLLGFSTAAVIVVCVEIFLTPIIGLLHIGEQQRAFSLDYIRILIGGMLITLSYNLCANMLRAIGDSFTPLIFLVIASITNVILDYTLILGFGLGVKGAAIATVLSQLLSVVLCLLRIYKSFPILHISREDFRISKKQVLSLYESGLSMGLMSSLVNFGSLVLQSGINQLGTSIIVAHTAARKTFEIWNLPISVIGSSMATFCGQNYGAGKYDRIRQGIKETLLLGTIWAAVIFVLAHTISPYLIRFIASTQNEEIIYWGKTYLEVDMSFLIICVLIVVLRNSMQGFGDYKTPVLSSFIELIGKLVFTFVFVKIFGYWGIIWTEPVIWFLMVMPLIVMSIKKNKAVFIKEEFDVKKYEIDMCSGSVFQKMLIFAVPLMFSSILQLLFNAADIVVVGRFAGDNALAAVGSNGALINLITNLFIGMSIGTNVLTAQYYGAKKESDLKETVHTSMLLSVYSGVLLTIIGIVCAKLLLELMQAPEEVLDLAVLYLRIYFLGMTSTMVYNFGSAILRAVGDTKRPLYYLLGAGIINVLLNLFFVIVCKMGVAGVAVATAVSQTVSAVLVVRCLMLEQSGIHLDLKSLAITKEKFGKILRIGLPAGFQGMVFSLSNVVIQSAVNSFGAIAVAGNSAASNLEGFVYMAMNAFYQATISFTSQNYGAREYRRIYRILLAGEIYVVATGVLLGNLMVFFGEFLLGIYSPSAQVIAAGMDRMRIICTVYALCGVMDVLVGALRGIGYSVIPMVVSLIGACGLRLLWIATIFKIPQYHNLTTVYLSYPITWTITLSVHALTFVIAGYKSLRT